MESIVGMKDSKSFDLVKQKLITTLILALPYFDLLFAIEIDAFGIGIEIVLKLEGRVIDYFSGKLSDARRN